MLKIISILAHENRQKTDEKTDKKTDKTDENRFL